MRLRAELPATQRELEEILVSRRAYRHFELAHPEAMRRVDLLDDEIATAAWELDVKRQDIDGIRPPPPRVHASGRGIERANLNRVCSMDLEIGL